MLILQILVFAIPVTFSAILHMVAVRFDWFSFLKIPLDFGKSLKNKRIFGDSKTWRGILLMVLFSIAGVALLRQLGCWFPSLRSLDILLYERHSVYFYGTLFGLGYTLAELPNSFIKRRKGLPEGKSVTVGGILADQLDSILGCMLLLYPFTEMTWKFIVLGLLVYTALHAFFNFLLYLVGLRKNPL